MSMIIQYSRISHHTTTDGTTFSIPLSENFTDGSWDKSNLVRSEFGVDELNKKLFIRIDDEIKEVCLDCDLENVEEFIKNYINDNIDFFKGEKGDAGEKGEKGDKGDAGEIDINKLIFEYEMRLYSLNDLFFKTIDLENRFKEFSKKCCNERSDIKCYDTRVLIGSKPIKIPKELGDRLCYKLEYRNCYCLLKDSEAISSFIKQGWCPVTTGWLKNECWFYRIDKFGRKYYTNFSTNEYATGRIYQYHELEWHQRFTRDKNKIREIAKKLGFNPDAAVADSYRNKIERKSQRPIDPKCFPASWGLR